MTASGTALGSLHACRGGQGGGNSLPHLAICPRCAQVVDVEQAKVRGLKGLTYLDKVRPATLHPCTGSLEQELFWHTAHSARATLATLFNYQPQPALNRALLCSAT